MITRIKTGKSSLLFLLIALMCLSWNNALCRNMNLDWQIGYHKTETEQPAKWFPSTVPGAVQLDVMKAENYKQPWWYADNVFQFDWMEDVWFTYRTSFNKPELQSGERLFFFSKGIDYQFKIYFNQKLLLEQEGMFTYVDIDLTDNLQDKNELIIVLLPVPNLGFPFLGGNTYRLNASKSAKPAVSYGWDWHPRLVTRGIWDETFLAVRKTVRISDVSVEYELNENLTRVTLQAVVDGVQLQGCSFKWILKNPQGEIVLEKNEKLTADQSSIKGELSDVQLWWPVGYGVPNLYTNEFILFDASNTQIEQQTAKTGFRKLKMIMNEGAWERFGVDLEAEGFPNTRAVVPASFEINNRRIFAKGSNWVHPEVFVGTITPERYKEQILLAKNANFNIVRVWGGGIVNKESFFDICDETGILVWQEFPLACNDYPDEPEYLRVLEQEARSIIKRVKKHTCLALWSGGNELFTPGGGMTDQSLALRLLNSLCYQLDPKTPFIATSPLYGMGHGGYLFDDFWGGSEEVFQVMPRHSKTAYTEFGVSSISFVDVLKSYIPENMLFPPRFNPVWEVHHGYNAWRYNDWLETPTMEKYFGEIKTIETYVAFSQLLQCEGLKFIFEEARRQKPYCAQAISWCYQEPWPTVGNCSIINWPNKTKPAYYHVANACRPVLVSARFPKFEWRRNEDFSCEIFMLNDTYQSLDSAKVTVTLQYDNGKEINLLTWDFPGTAEFCNLKGPTAHVKIPEMKTGWFAIHVKVEGKKEYNSVYALSYVDQNVQKLIPSKSYYNEQPELSTF